MLRMKLAELRQRLNRRTLALLAVLSIALSGTGIASLAQLTDPISATVNASITTIDVSVNSVKNATINLPSGLIPGDFAYASLHITNSGTGYAKLPNSGAAILSGSGQFLTDSTKKVFMTVAPENCNPTGLPWASGGTITPAASQLWDNEPQVNAGEFLDVCVIYKLGTAGATYSDGISAWSLNYPIAAYYP